MDGDVEARVHLQVVTGNFQSAAKYHPPCCCHRLVIIAADLLCAKNVPQRCLLFFTRLFLLLAARWCSG